MPGVTYAISNIEDQRPGPPKEGFSGAVELGFSGKNGDKEEKDYSAASRINYRKNKDFFFVIASGEYGSTRDVKDSDEAFIHFRWTHKLSPSWSTEAFTQWEDDKFANLSSRVLVGGGGRYLVSSEENKYSLSVGLGAFHESEKLNLGTYSEETDIVRVNMYYSYVHKLNDKTSISSTTYVQPSTEDSDDLRALFTFGLTVKMTDALAIKLSYQAKHDSQPAQNLAVDPPIDNSKTNTEYTTSLVYQF